MKIERVVGNLSMKGMNLSQLLCTKNHGFSVTRSTMMEPYNVGLKMGKWICDYNN